MADTDTRHPAPPKLLADVRKVLRLHHYSIHTERAYVEWIVRFVRFHRMRSRADLVPAEAKIEAFLTDLAVQGNVAASTQNQAMNALVFLTSASSTRGWKTASMPSAPTRKSTFLW
jgi:integrase-like protein